MSAQTGIALLITIASACALNWGYLTEHSAASRLPPLTLQRPIHSLRMLLSNRQWLLGFASECTGWGLYVLAVALAPLSLVQAASAGGIGVLAFFVARITGVRLGLKERLGVLVAILGLFLLGISLAGGTAEGHDADTWELGLWLGCSLGAAALAAGPAARFLASGAAYGVGTGILFAAGDVSTKVMTMGGEHLLVVPIMLVFYAAGTIMLQMGFQRGGPLVTAGLATLFTNAIPIAAGMTIFGEPLPGGAMGVLRVLSFAAVVLGAMLLARPEKKTELAEDSERLPGALTTIH